MSPPRLGADLERAEPQRPPKSGSPISSARVLVAQLRHSGLGRLFDSAAELVSSVASPARVVIYPGQFDPFHRSHLEELKGALAATGFRDACVVPVRGAPGVYSRHAPDWLRMLVIEESVKDEPGVVVDNLGLRGGIRTAPELVTEYRRRFGKNADVVLLLGSDNVEKIGTWKNIETLFGEVDILVSLRKGAAQDRLFEGLPSSIREAYVARDGDFWNPQTKRWIRFVDMQAGETSSREIIEAIQRHDTLATETLLAPPARELVTAYHYENLPYVQLKHRWALADAMSPSFHEHFDESVALALSEDAEFLDLLLGIRPDAESTAEIAGGVMNAVRRSGVSLDRHPTLYSQAVRWSLQQEVRTSLEELSDKTQEGSGSSANVGSRVARHVARSSNVRDHSERPLFPWARKILWRVLRYATDPYRKPKKGDVRLAVRSAKLSTCFKDETVRVYTGIPHYANLEEIRAGGLTSQAERRLGKAEADRRVADAGEVAAFLHSNFSHYDKDAVTFVSASLSPSVAESYAGHGGYVVVSDVPATHALFANDPQVWAATPFRRVGNPEQILHEVALRDVRPEWIAEIREISGSMNDFVHKRNRETFGQLKRAFLPLTRCIFSRFLRIK